MPLVRCVLGLLALALIALVFALAPEVPFIILAGVLLGLLIRMPSLWLSAKVGVPYWVAAAAVWIAVLGAAVFFVWAVGPQIAEQGRLLGAQLPSVARSTIRRLQHPPAWAREFVSPPSSSELRPPASSVVAGATDVVIGLTALLGALVVVLFIGLYSSLSPASHVRAALAVVPSHRRDRAREALREMADTLGRWLIGRLVAMTFVGIFSWLGLKLLGVPAALALGIIAGLFTFVEYLGAVVSAVPAVLLAFTSGPLMVMWVVVLYLVVHVIEGYLLTPLITRQSVRFPPAYTLSAQIALGGLFGVLGLTFATPLCVLGTVLAKAVSRERE
jgi:predicted PurR-regulated permease PerM